MIQHYSYPNSGSGITIGAQRLSISIQQYLILPIVAIKCAQLPARKQLINNKITK